MKLSRDKIQRMVGADIGGSAGGGGGESMGGFATQAWVDNNYVSIEWFDQIFQVFDDSTKLDVNGEFPVDTSKLNIKAMFGFWTDFYISALGNGGQVGASIMLASLADVNVAGVQNGQVLTWNSAQSKWIASTPSSGVDMTVVWNALAANTNEQINASHLSTALTGYATQNWVGQQGYLTSTDINDMATETWVGQHYLPLNGGYMVGSIYFNNAGAYSPNGTYARLLASSDHIGGLVLQLGSGNGQYNRFEIINHAWDASRFMVENDGTVRFGLLASDYNGTVHIGSSQITAASVNSILRVYQSSGNETFPIATGGATKGLILGIDNTGDPVVGTYGTRGTDFTYLRLGGLVKVDLGLDIFNTADNTPYIDFHYNNSSADYTSRIIESDSGLLTFLCSQRITGTLGVTGNVGIGTYYPSYKLHVDGVIYSTTGVYSAGYVTALSDEREKNIIENFEISLDFIAKAPIVSYEWKDQEHHDDKQHIGSIAQYWLREMPELVPEVNGRYTMDYGRIALLSAITVARTVVNHEQRLRELERRLFNN